MLQHSALAQAVSGCVRVFVWPRLQFGVLDIATAEMKVYITELIAHTYDFGMDRRRDDGRWDPATQTCLALIRKSRAGFGLPGPV